MSVPRNSDLPSGRKERRSKNNKANGTSDNITDTSSNTKSSINSSNKSSSTSSSSTKVRVVGRIRPLAKYEIKNGSRAIVTKVPGSGGRGLPETLRIEDGDNVSGGSKNTNRWFELDAVLDETSNQRDVYVQSGAQAAISDDLFCGYNATILAYGQTGSGKTFTMGTASSTTTDDEDDGANETDGVIPRACRDLFDNVAHKCDGQAEVRCSYMEVYNEEIRDLLIEGKQQQARSQLRIRETLDGQIYVRGLTERIVTSPRDVYKIMEEANQRRVVASTKMNATSSRSHAICVIKIKGVVVVVSDDDVKDSNSNHSRPESDDGISRKFESKLTLVDLAGSERLKKTQAKGSRAKEGISINKGLFVLGQVVSALAEKGRALQENSKNTESSKTRKSLPFRKPPYRDSKLTRLLQDSLGGNSRTIMIACVSPADFNADETINTLRYATQARNISNTATANLVETISQSEARKLKRENALLQTQIEELEATIAKLTQNVTEDDLERSMSIIQQEQHHSLQLGARTKSFADDEEEKKDCASDAETGMEDDGNGEILNEKTIHRSNLSPLPKKRGKVALGDHFEQSQHEIKEINTTSDGDDDADDKDSVSLLVDDVFEKRRPSSFRKPKRKPSITSQNTNRTIEELEDENAELEARLLLAEKDVRATARDTAVELPKLKKRVQQLEDSLTESKWLEHEARALQEQLAEARADKTSAQKAAQQLADFMANQKGQTGFRGDELTMEKVNYSRHKLNEDWVRFIVIVLNSFKEEMRLLGDYFQMVVKVVESPKILDMLGTLNNRQRRQQAESFGIGWWKSKEQKEKETSAVAAEKELRNTLLKEHIVFFNDRLVEIEDEVNLRSDNIDVVLEGLLNERGKIEADFETDDEVKSIRDLYSKKGEKLLFQLTELMKGKLFNRTSQERTMLVEVA